MIKIAIYYLCENFIQMLKKGSKVYSILTGTCPNCHKESMYERNNPYILSKLFSMKPFCSHCKTVYNIEPSFFYGAMYVSYGLGVALSVASYVICVLFLNLSLKTQFITIIGALIVFCPVLIRLSRNIWINIFMNYNENKHIKP